MKDFKEGEYVDLVPVLDSQEVKKSTMEILNPRLETSEIAKK